MSFADLVGHEAAREVFARWLRVGRIPHAVLLLGPEGVGKFRFAEAASKVLLCARGGEEACGRCPSCKKCGARVHPDLWVLEPSGRGGSIGIDAIRGGRRAGTGGGGEVGDAGSGAVEGAAPSSAGSPDSGEALGLLGWVARRPLEGSRKCAILRDADRLTPEAAGSLLKTLEEPPPETVFFLTAPSSGDLPETVVSRCRTIRFLALDEEVLARHLETKEGAGSDAAAAAARAAGGSVAEALEALRGDAARLTGLFDRFLREEGEPLRLREEVFEGLAPGASAAGRRERARTFFRCAIAVLRGRWRGLVACGEDRPYGERRSSSLSRLERALEAGGEALRDLERYVDPGLLVDDFALGLRSQPEEGCSPTRRSGTG